MFNVQYASNRGVIQFIAKELQIACFEKADGFDYSKLQILIRTTVEKQLEMPGNQLLQVISDLSISLYLVKQIGQQNYYLRHKFDNQSFKNLRMSQKTQKKLANQTSNSNSCHSKSHVHDHSHEHKLSCNNEVDHIIKLLQQKFISPFKLIYMIDQKEADYFKIRNKLGSCCTNSSITIPKDEMSTLQKIVAEKVSRGFLLTRFQDILEFCDQKYQNIKQGGVKSGMEFNDQVQKFLIDKVLSEAVNLFLFKQISKELQFENKKMSFSMGLWATPATWYAQYPNTQLDFLNGKCLSQLDKQGFTISKKFFVNQKENLFDELSLIQKDGKFEEKLWKDQNRNDKKILTTPQIVLSFNKNSQNCRFPNLKSVILMIKALPFELNSKMNAFCLINDCIHVSYFSEKGYQKYKRDNTSRYSILSFVGTNGNLFTKSIESEKETEVALNQGDLLVIDNNKILFQFQTMNNNCFLIRSWIVCIKRQQ